MKTTLTYSIAALLAIGICLSVFGGRDRNEDLVVHLKFDRVSQDGNQTPDDSGNGHAGRLHGQRTIAGILGSALEFRGFDQIVEIGDLKLRAPVTVAFWIRTNDLIRDRRLFSQLDGPPNQSGALRLDGAQVEVASHQGWKPVIRNGLRFAQWMHIAVVFDRRGNATGYLNGQAQSTVAATCDYDGVRAGIGASLPGTSGNLFTGAMDDFRCYRRALSPAEIARLHDLGLSSK